MLVSQCRLILALACHHRRVDGGLEADKEPLHEHEVHHTKPTPTVNSISWCFHCGISSVRPPSDSRYLEYDATALAADVTVPVVGLEHLR
jgi:hypothetical protein